MSWPLSVLLACSNPGSGTVADAPAGDTAATALDASLTFSELVPTVATVSWEAPEGARAWVEYGLDGALDLRTPEVDGPAVRVPLLGLKAGRSYAWRPVHEGPTGRVEGRIESLEVVPRPSGLPRLAVGIDGASEMAEGFVLVSVTSELGGEEARAWVAIYDGDGDPVWWWQHPDGHVTVSPSLGATPGTLLWDRYDMRTTDLWAVATQVAIDGTSSVEVSLAQGHHAVIEPDPGVIAWIARDIRENPSGNGYVTADRLFEAPIDDLAAAREVVALYDDLFGGTFSSPCEHASTGLVYEGLSPVYEWTHTNSLVYLQELDAYLLHARWTDTALLVDRASGAILWQLGGPDSDFTLPGGGSPWSSVEDTLLSHAHLSEAWDGGLVAFDNGSHRSPRVSSIVELAWDAGAGTVREVFRWEDPRGRYTGALGDVRKLPGGGYLATWAIHGEITEVSADGELVWAATTDPLRAVSRAVFLKDLYAWVP